MLDHNPTLSAIRIIDRDLARRLIPLPLDDGARLWDRLSRVVVALVVIILIVARGC